MGFHLSARGSAAARIDFGETEGRGRRDAAPDALHSRMFTRLQLRAWLQSPSPDAEPAEASRVIASLRNLDLATEEELAGISRCLHIHAKQVYRALGETDNRNRRCPGREKAVERLVCLTKCWTIPASPGCRPRVARRGRAMRRGSIAESG